MNQVDGIRERVILEIMHASMARSMATVDDWGLLNPTTTRFIQQGVMSAISHMFRPERLKDQGEIVMATVDVAQRLMPVATQMAMGDPSLNEIEELVDDMYSYYVELDDPIEKLMPVIVMNYTSLVATIGGYVLENPEDSKMLMQKLFVSIGAPRISMSYMMDPESMDLNDDQLLSAAWQICLNAALIVVVAVVTSFVPSELADSEGEETDYLLWRSDTIDRLLHQMANSFAHTLADMALIMTDADPEMVEEQPVVMDSMF